jgi:PAS domain S-box-containing protein
MGHVEPASSGRKRTDPAALLADELMPAGRARILIVDDDERNLLAIRIVVEDLADVVTAASGEEALRHLLQEEFALILLDVLMTGMDGYETAQIIRQREQTRHIPIVFVTAVNKDSEHLLRGYAMGAVDYIFKPVEPVILRSKVAVFVDLFNMRREIQHKARHEQALLDANLRANAERLRVEQELRVAEQRQAAIIRSLPIILYFEKVTAGQRLPGFVGENLAAVTGFRPDDVRDGRFWIDRVHPEDRQRMLDAAATRLRTGAMAVEYRWQCADGRYKYLLDQSVLLQGSDGVDHFAGTLLDVTDRKELERQLQQAHKMDAIGKLTGGIAHDFNNLLAAVLGGIALIERRVPLDETQMRLVGMTRHAAEQGSELIKHLLAFARQQQLQPAEIEIRQLAATMTELLGHTLGGLVQVEWLVPERLWPVYADAAQLELAVMNLAINARDAMAEGGSITIDCSNHKVDDTNEHGLAVGDYVLLTVSDTGCGIAPDMLELVTEPFFTTKEVGKGTGLGLSMVYGFARQSGGSLDIRSEVGVGTSVEVWLPRAKRTAPAVSNRPVRSDIDCVRYRSLRILLVDDHDAVRETTAALLHDLGHSVALARDGQAMLRMLEAGPADYDLVVTDYAMPLLSGGDALLRARQIRPDLPGLIISGYADVRSIDRKPADVAVITKPFAPEELSRMIAEVCALESAR